MSNLDILLSIKKSLKGIIDKSAEHAPSMVPAEKWESYQSFGKLGVMLFKNYFYALKVYVYAYVCMIQIYILKFVYSFVYFGIWSPQFGVWSKTRIVWA